MEMGDETRTGSSVVIGCGRTTVVFGPAVDVFCFCCWFGDDEPIPASCVLALE